MKKFSYRQQVAIPQRRFRVATLKRIRQIPDSLAEQSVRMMVHCEVPLNKNHISVQLE